MAHAGRILKAEGRSDKALRDLARAPKEGDVKTGGTARSRTRRSRSSSPSTARCAPATPPANSPSSPARRRPSGASGSRARRSRRSSTARTSRAHDRCRSAQEGRDVGGGRAEGRGLPLRLRAPHQLRTERRAPRRAVLHVHRPQHPVASSRASPPSPASSRTTRRSVRRRPRRPGWTRRPEGTATSPTSSSRRASSSRTAGRRTCPNGSSATPASRSRLEGPQVHGLVRPPARDLNEVPGAAGKTRPRVLQEGDEPRHADRQGPARVLQQLQLLLP
jgi:hypothetical protein